MKIVSKSTYVPALLSSLMLFCLGSMAHAADDILGTWAMTNGKVTVAIQNCEAGTLCARIVALAKPLDKQGQPKVDRKNPDSSLRTRPIIGLMLLHGLKPTGEKQWKGKIYNPDDGRTYNSIVQINGDQMKVKGCVLVICVTQKFKRVD